MATGSSDPFSANLLKNVFSPKLVSDGVGGYQAKVDLKNIDSIIGYNPIYNSDDLIIANGTIDTTTIVVSTDGQNWAPPTNPVSNFDVFDTVYNGSYWIAIGIGSGGYNFIHSIDGQTWTIPTGININCFTSPSCIAWNGSYWLAGGIGASGTIYKSFDGKNWNLATTPYFFNGCYRITWNGSYWVGIGQGTNTIGISYDGLTWVAPSGTNGNFFGGPGGIASDVAWNGQYWVAVGAGPNGTIGVSIDGQNWTPSTNDFFVNGVGRSLRWNGQYWVAVGAGNNGSIAISTDGQTWLPPSGTNSNFFVNGGGVGITWVGPYWVAVGTGNNGGIAISTDGQTWLPPSGTNSSLFSSFIINVKSTNIWSMSKPLHLEDSINRIAKYLSYNFGVLI